MKAVGIVVEYNPLHNGHLHHIHQAKMISNADIVIAVMSGHFLQRGEPAIVDKWYRAEMALTEGVDIVIELPYVFSTAQASDFAKGAISLLSAIGCESFAFGSENGSITPFLNTYHLINNNRVEYNSLIRQALQTGISYPKALHFAYEQLQQKEPNSYVDLAQPNNILGFHYIEAAQSLQNTIKPFTIARIGAGYHDDIDASKAIASATGIRKAIFEQNDLQAAQCYLPNTSYQLLKQWQENFGTFGSWEAFWPLLQFSILRYTPEQLTQYAEVTEGIEFALIKAAKASNNFKEFMLKIKSKRYTWTRLQRILTHIYTGFTKDQLQSSTSPSLIRLLGMTKEGQRYLSMYKKEFTLPLISRVGAIDNPILQIDVHATDMYTLGIGLHSQTAAFNKDYQRPPIRVE